MGWCYNSEQQDIPRNRLRRYKQEVEQRAEFWWSATGWLAGWLVKLNVFCTASYNLTPFLPLKCLADPLKKCCCYLEPGLWLIKKRSIAIAVLTSRSSQRPPIWNQAIHNILELIVNINKWKKEPTRFWWTAGRPDEKGDQFCLRPCLGAWDVSKEAERQPTRRLILSLWLHAEVQFSNKQRSRRRRAWSLIQAGRPTDREFGIWPSDMQWQNSPAFFDGELVG